MASPSTTGRRYGGKTDEQRRGERRERLLDAGLELFGTIGYARTTIEMLCAATRLNARYLYEEFQTREELLGAVYDRHIEAVTRAVVLAIGAPGLEPLARLEAGLRAFLDAILVDERAARINYFEVVGVSPELERRRRDVLHGYADMIAEQMAAGAATWPLPDGDHRLMAVAIVGATDGLIIDWLSNEPRGDRQAIVAALLTLVGPLVEQGDG